MIQIICDKCREDCNLIAYDLTIGIIHNPCPTHIFDAGDAKMTCDHTKIRMVLCQNCYRSFGFPNIYKAAREKRLTWRDVKQGGAEDGG